MSLEAQKRVLFSEEKSQKRLHFVEVPRRDISELPRRHYFHLPKLVPHDSVSLLCRGIPPRVRCVRHSGISDVRIGRLIHLVAHLPTTLLLHAAHRSELAAGGDLRPREGGSGVVLFMSWLFLRRVLQRMLIFGWLRTLVSRVWCFYFEKRPLNWPQ